MQDFPESHVKRRAVIVLNQSDIETCRYDLPPDDRSFLYSEEAFVLPTSTTSSAGDCLALANIFDADQARHGAILIQSPYDRDVYSELSEAKEVFSMEKMRHFIRLCQILGASKVELKQVDITKEGRTSTFDVKGQTTFATADIKTETAISNVLTNMFSISSSYSGGDPDIEEAERYLRKNQLWNDSVLRGLVEQRGHINNPIRDQNICINLTREANKSLSVAANLNLPVKNIGIQGNYKKVATASEELNLTMMVVF
jgi:hypothetical protein